MRLRWRTRLALQKASMTLMFLGFLALIWIAATQTPEVKEHDMPHAYCYTARMNISCVPKH